MKCYQICVVMVFVLGYLVLLFDVVKQILMYYVCIMFRVVEIIVVLNDVGIDVCWEEDMCLFNSVGIWIIVDVYMVLFQCQFEVLEVY